ncbi:hypothetical protein FQZ97_476060 [compost metagenome]
MKSCINVIFLLIIFPGLRAWADDRYVDTSETMCDVGEVIYISCSLESNSTTKKYVGPVVSICAKGNFSPVSGYVRYRSGTPGKSVLMEFPEQNVAPKGIFRIYRSSNPKGAGRALRFQKNEYIFSFERSGVSGYKFVVWKQGNKVSDGQCDEPGRNYLVDDAYIGIDFLDLGRQRIPDADN